MPRDNTPAEVTDSARALAIPATTEEGLDVVETPAGNVWLRFVSSYKVLGMNLVSPDDLTRLGNDLIAAGEIARGRRRGRRAGLN